ncbi:hypothetical protein [Sphingopyxis sp. QXT-31]|uniref:hypothetical protein n=1 Tax=Sphingopyxis sp. QXT-31 TaxID=1357916 RepID=UPI0012EC733F|nr:hypothetical protein [Sphingopyxis sp. QXT-31]
MPFSNLFGGRRAAARLADDLDALQQMRLKHGDNTRPELERRAGDRGLNARDRRHWQRLLTLAEEDGL